MKGLPPGPGAISRHFCSAGVVPRPSALKKLADRYGDTFRVPYISGPVTYTGNPEALRSIYSADPANFDVWGVTATVPIFGTGSVAVTSGDRHRRDRKLLWAAFQTSLREFGPTIARVARTESSRWTIGQPFSMLESTQAITLNIILEVIFGIDDKQRLNKTRTAVRELIDSLHPFLFMFPALRRNFGGFGPWAKNCRAVSALNALLLEEIRGRAAGKANDNSILGRILAARYEDGGAVSEVEILDQLRGLLFAGHETTATVLAWIFYWIAREPEIYERILTELRSAGGDVDLGEFGQLSYLDAVCREGLRLYPPVVDPSRIPRRPFQMLGYTIPAGEAIRPSPLILHSREDLYPEPEKFRPERFLERNFSSYEYIPFGGGARRCLGAGFALYEMKVTLATVLQSHRLELLDHRPIKHIRLGATFGPEGNVHMISRGSPATPKVRRSARESFATPAEVTP
jgi:cytochrome P450 family 110